MERKIILPVLASILILSIGFPVDAFGSLIGDDVTVEFVLVGQQTMTVVNDLVNPEFVFPSFASSPVDVTVNVESEEFWIEYTNTSPTTTIFILGFDFWITDLDWIVNGVEIPGVIQDVMCTQMATNPLDFGTITFPNDMIHIPLNSVKLNPNETVGLHCNIDVIHDVQVGGTYIPIDQSALLLAGAQSISMWMIPVVIAGIGIGVFVIKRRN